MEAILRYTDLYQDGKKVFEALASNNIEILKTTVEAYITYYVTIHIKDNNELNKIVTLLNRECVSTVSVIDVSSDEQQIEIKESIKDNILFAALIAVAVLGLALAIL